MCTHLHYALTSRREECDSLWKTCGQDDELADKIANPLENEYWCGLDRSPSPPLRISLRVGAICKRSIESGDIAPLLAHRRQAPDAVCAHPTEEHLLPLFPALGAAHGGAKPRYVAGGAHYGMLSMDAWMFT